MFLGLRCGKTSMYVLLLVLGSMSCVCETLSSELHNLCRVGLSSLVVELGLFPASSNAENVGFVVFVHKYV